MHAAPVALAAAALAFPATAGARSLEATAVRSRPDALRVTVRFDVTVPYRMRARVWTDGCARPEPSWLICGPAEKRRRIVLHRGHNRRTVHVRAQRMEYAPVPDGAGLGPWWERLVPASTDVAFVGVRAHGRELFRARVAG